MSKPLPAFMLRYERLVNEELLRVGHLSETEGTVKDLEQFPVVACHNLGSAIAISKAGGWSKLGGRSPA